MKVLRASTLLVPVLGLVLLLASPEPVTVPVAALPAPTTTTLVPVTVMAQWQKVAWCEHHGDWAFNGSTFDGGLGIARWNWVHFGGLEFASAPHLATPEQQVVVARRIQAFGKVPDHVPDQQDCGAW